MNIPRLQEETLDLKWIQGNLISLNPQHKKLQEAMDITRELLEECRVKAKIMTDEQLFNLSFDEAKSISL